ncbi:MAG: hypothetical protein VW338_04725 [Rhodospirillaceae bacterium]
MADDSFTPSSFGSVGLGIPSYSVTLTDRSRVLNPPPGGGLVGFQIEPLVRPFETGNPYADKLVNRLIARRPGPSDGEASLRWGGPSRFEARAPEYPTITITGGSDDQDVIDELDVPTLEFEEHERTVSEIRVENPDDPDQYVMVERIETITWRGPDLRPAEELARHAQANGIAKITRLPFIFWKYTLDHDADQVT